MPFIAVAVRPITYQSQSVLIPIGLSCQKTRFKCSYVDCDFLEKQLFLELLESKVENKKHLEKAAKLLYNTLQSSLAEKSTIHLEANLLLAKLHYYWYPPQRLDAKLLFTFS